MRVTAGELLLLGAGPGTKQLGRHGWHLYEASEEVAELVCHVADAEAAPADGLHIRRRPGDRLSQYAEKFQNHSRCGKMWGESCPSASEGQHEMVELHTSWLSPSTACLPALREGGQPSRGWTRRQVAELAGGGGMKADAASQLTCVKAHLHALLSDMVPADEAGRLQRGHHCGCHRSDTRR